MPLALHLSGSFLHRYHQVTAAAYLHQIRDMRLLTHPALRGRGTEWSPTNHELDVGRTFSISLAQLKDQDPKNGVARTLLAQTVCFAPGEVIPHDLLVKPPAGSGEGLEEFLMLEDGLDRLTALGFISLSSERSVLIHRLLNLAAKDMLPQAALLQAQEAVEMGVIERLTTQWEAEIYLGQLPLPPSQLRYLTDQALLRLDRRAARLADLFGCHLADRFEWEEARPYLETAVEIWRERIKEPHLDFAASLTNLGRFYLEQVQMKEATTCFEEAVVVSRSVVGPNHKQTVESQINLAFVMSRQGQWKAAERIYLQALEILERELDPSDPIIAYLLRHLALHYRFMGKYHLANQCFSRALTIREAQLGAEHPETARILLNFGLLQYRLGDYEKSLSYYKRANKIMETNFGAESLQVAHSLFCIGMVLTAQGENVRGELLMRQGIAIQLTGFAKSHPLIGLAESVLASALLPQGKYEEAEALLEHALKLLHNAAGYQEEYADTLDRFGRLRQAQGDTAAAKGYFEEALAYREKWLPPNHPSPAFTLLFLAECHKAMGELETAQRLFDRAQEIIISAELENHPQLQLLQSALE